MREIEWEVVSAVRDDDKRGGLEGFREVIRRTRDGVFKPRVVTMAYADNLPVPPQYALRYLSVRICSIPYQYTTQLGTFFHLYRLCNIMVYVTNKGLVEYDLHR